jgi:hypothetical protein
MTKKEIAEKILINEDELFNKIVESAKKIFKLDNRGEIYWMVPYTNLTDKEKITIVLLAQNLAFEAGIAETNYLENTAIASKLSIEPASVTARLKDLRESRMVTQVKRGVHQINLHRVENFIADIQAKIKES